MKSLAYSTSKQVDPSQLETFHAFLRFYVSFYVILFLRNVLSTNDETYKILKNVLKKTV